MRTPTPRRANGNFPKPPAVRRHAQLPRHQVQTPASSKGLYHPEPANYQNSARNGRPVVARHRAHYPPMVYNHPTWYPRPQYRNWEKPHRWPYYPWRFHRPTVWRSPHSLLWNPPSYRQDEINVRLRLHGEVPLQNVQDEEVFTVEARHYYGSPMVDVVLHVEQSRYTYSGQYHQLIPVNGWDHEHFVEFDLTAVGADLQQPVWADVTTYGPNDPVDIEFDDSKAPAGATTYYWVDMKRLDPQGRPVTVIHGEVSAYSGAHQRLTIGAESPLHVTPEEWLSQGNRYVVEVNALREYPNGTRELDDVCRAEFTYGEESSTDRRTVNRMRLFELLVDPTEVRTDTDR